MLYTALRLLAIGAAPILCFTAEDIWQHMPRRADDPDSVHLQLFGLGWSSAAEAELAPVLELRQRVLAALEPFRAAGKDSLDARVQITAPDATIAKLFAYGLPNFADLCIVSQVEVTPGATATEQITVDAAVGHGCQRCWKVTPEEPLCARCASVVSSLA